MTQPLIHPVQRARWRWCFPHACAGAVDTRSYGDVKDQVGRPCDNGQLLVLDPALRVAGMQLYDGILKVRCRVVEGARMRVVRGGCWCQGPGAAGGGHAAPRRHLQGALQGGGWGWWVGESVAVAATAPGRRD